jgi:hypothetical protein
MYQSFALAFRRLTLLLLCCLPLSSQAASTKEAPIDLSIIEQRDALRPYMTQQQRVDYIEAAQLIKEGKSDIRSGENLQAQKTSTFNPNKDLKPIHDRGERLVEEGQATLLEGQKKLVALLTEVKAQQVTSQAIAAKKYNFELVEEEYAAAIEQAATETLENCRDAGYNNIFYDGLRIITAEQHTKAAPKVHNATYDTFIQADGTHFNVKVPLSLKLAQDDTTAEYAFQYDNASVFAGEKVALLAIEVIAPGSETEALLSVRALDLDTQRLISSVLFYIPDASEVLTPESETATSTDEIIEASSSEAASDEVASTLIAAAPRTIPVSVTINDQNQLIDKLSGLASPYSFETIAAADTTAQSVLVADLLKDTLLKNSALILAEGSYIQRSYLPAEAAPESIPSAATATLAITQNEDNYTMIAKAHESDRALEIGTVTLNLPE